MFTDQKRTRTLCVCFLTLTVLWIALIIRMSLQPAPVSSQESDVVRELLQVEDTVAANRLIRKAAHFAEYFVLGGLLWTDCFLLAGQKTVLSIGSGLLIAVMDESIQTMVPGRAGRLIDVAIDLVGVCAACLLLMQLAHRSAERKKKRRVKNGGGE